MIVLVLASGLALGGCSFSYQLDSLFGSKDNPENTGAIRASTAGTVGLPAGNDLAYTRAAVSEVLSRDGDDASVPWENPRTGARGTITPTGDRREEGGATCRNFLASYVLATNESWLQGEACRIGDGKWDVRSMRPWKKT